MLRQQLEHDSASTELCKVACPPFFDGFSPFSTVFPIELNRESLDESGIGPFSGSPAPSRNGGNGENGISASR